LTDAQVVDVVLAVLQAAASFALLAVTWAYVDATRRISVANEMSVLELREQRIAAAQPLLLFVSGRYTRLGGSPYTVALSIQNFGTGPALDVIVSVQSDEQGWLTETDGTSYTFPAAASGTVRSGIRFSRPTATARWPIRLQLLFGDIYGRSFSVSQLLTYGESLELQAAGSPDVSIRANAKPIS
jgi:hypothetical protein